MRFYTKKHKHYCGIDLHAKKMFLCILDVEGNVLLHRNIDSSPEAFLKTVAPFRDELVVGVGHPKVRMLFVGFINFKPNRWTFS